MKLISVEEIKKALFSKGYTGAVALLVLGGLLIMLGGGIMTNKEQSADYQITEEERLSEMCSQMSGVGRCRVMLTYRGGERDGEVYAVLLLCEGADSLSVRRDLTALVCSLYGIGANRVEIFTLNE